MSDRYKAMVECGIAQPDEHVIVVPNVASDYSISSFSGYGAYTPITVRSHTKLIDADLERDKQRN